MARPRKIDSAIVRDLYENKRMSVGMIAAQLECSHATVTNRLRENFVELREPPNWLALPTEEIKSRYLSGESMLAISKSLGCSESCIRERIERGGYLKEQRQLRKQYRRVNFTKDQLVDLYLTQGKSDMQIGREFDVSNLTVANWRKFYGIRRERQSNYVDLSSDELKRLYVDEKWSMDQMAQHFGCGESTVRAHIIRDGLAIDKAEVAKRRVELNRAKSSYRHACRGYRFIKVEGHPAASDDGYVAEHRYVAETGLGRYLEPREQVHHISMQKLDNRIENLAVLANKEDHAKLHKYLERIGVYLSGLSTVRPEPLVFSTQTFWGGQYVTGIDLTSNPSLLSAPRSTGQEGMAVRPGEGTDSLVVN